MRHVKAGITGIVVALVFAIIWIIVTHPCIAGLMPPLETAGIGACSVDATFTMFPVSFIGFVVGFAWAFRRARSAA